MARAKKKISEVILTSGGSHLIYVYLIGTSGNVVREILNGRHKEGGVVSHTVIKYFL